MTFGSIFLQKGSLYPHTLMYFHWTWTHWSLGRVTYDLNSLGVKDHSEVNDLFLTLTGMGVKSYITMIAQVCDHESRWDSWFKNRRLFVFVCFVCIYFFLLELAVVCKGLGPFCDNHNIIYFFHTCSIQQTQENIIHYCKNIVEED